MKVSQAACMRYVGARFIEVCGRELSMRKHAGKHSRALMHELCEGDLEVYRLLDNNEHLWKISVVRVHRTSPFKNDLGANIRNGSSLAALLRN